VQLDFYAIACIFLYFLFFSIYLAGKLTVLPFNVFSSPRTYFVPADERGGGARFRADEPGVPGEEHGGGAGVPLGRMEGLAMNEYGVPPRDMNMQDLQYNITTEVSTLSEARPWTHPVFLDPCPSTSRAGRSSRTSTSGSRMSGSTCAYFRPVLEKDIRLL
jgi:hypothetical protein